MAFIGGTETYGKYIAKPFPDLVQEAYNMPCLNLGSMNSSIDAFVNDESILALASQAKVTVIQLTGAHNMSNRFYTVHPRRNDRFIKAATLMQTIFNDVDFTDFSFTRHMLSTLNTVAPEKFGVVVQELKSAWKARMETVIKRIGGRVVLLWISDRPPGENEGSGDLGPDPLFIDMEMINHVRAIATDYVEVVVPDHIQGMGTDGMVFPQMEAAAAGECYGPAMHRLVADRLSDVIQLVPEQQEVETKT